LGIAGTLLLLCCVVAVMCCQSRTRKDREQKKGPPLEIVNSTSGRTTTTAGGEGVLTPSSPLSGTFGMTANPTLTPRSEPGAPDALTMGAVEHDMVDELPLPSTYTLPKYTDKWIGVQMEMESVHGSEMNENKDFILNMVLGAGEENDECSEEDEEEDQTKTETNDLDAMYDSHSGDHQTPGM